MQRTAVQSKAFKSYAYDSQKQILEVEFHSRKEGEPPKVYQYSDIPQSVVDEWMKAESLGSFLLKSIINKYPFKRIEASDEEKAKAQTSPPAA